MVKLTALGVAYTIPDLDASVRVLVHSADRNKVACIEAALSNGKTAYHPAVSWTMAIMTGIGLVVSAITLETATHVTFYIISLFGYMQSQALIGMTAVSLPPIVDSWTQNFQWSMGVISVGFIDSFCTWYQRATGGTPSTFLADASTTSIHVLKRRSYGSAFDGMSKRDDKTEALKPNIVVRGVERIAFRAGIEVTNVFLTGLVFFLVFIAIVILASLLKTGYEVFIKSKGSKSHSFKSFIDEWRRTVKPIIFRVTFIGYPQMCTLCLWEITQRDSVAEIILAIVMFLSMTATLGVGLYKVVRAPTRGDLTYGLSPNPNEWEFLRAQYKPAAYFFATIGFAYIFLRSAFVGLSQASAVVQAIAFLLLQAAILIAVSIYKPWSDRRANIFNISIKAITSLNAILLLFFLGILKQPTLVTGIMGVAFFVINAITTLILILTVLIAAGITIFSKRTPSTCLYKPLPDANPISTPLPTTTQSQTELTHIREPTLPQIDRDPDRSAPQSLYRTTKVKHRAFPSNRKRRSEIGTPLQPTQFLAPYSRNAPSSLADLSVPLLPSDGLLSSRGSSPGRYGGSGGSGSVSPLRRVGI